MRAAGDAGGQHQDVPLTQIELADAVGLSPVHVNRVLQDLRARGLIELTRGKLLIRDWARTVHVAEFDSAYLGLSASGESTHAALLFPPRHAAEPTDRRGRVPLPQR